MLRILLIDDNPNDRLIASRELGQAFAELEIQSAIDAASLEQALAAGNFDCVITDYQIRWSNGLQVLEAVKARYPHCPVIMFTDSGSEEVAVTGMKAGLSDYVLKGRPLYRLSIAVQESLQKQQLHQQYDATVAQLSLSEERLRLAMTTAQMGTWDWNLTTGEIVWSATHERLFGLAANRFDGTYETFLDCIHPNDRDATRRAITQALETKTEYKHEHRVVWADNSVRWIAGRGKFFYSPTGEATRMIGVVLDITERKQAEAEQARLLQLEQAARTSAETANRLKDEFLATLSHELRSPLNAILGWAQLLRARQLNSAKTAQAIETIERNAKLQTQLIEDLLDVSRIMQGKLLLKVTVVSLITLIEAAIDTMRLAADAKAIDLQFWIVSPDFETANPQFKVLGDANRLQQVMWNLLANAIKFTHTGGRVEVRLEAQPATDKQTDPDHAESPIALPNFSLSAPSWFAQITVTDTGKGIPADFLPFVFDSFRQADASITRSYSGLGLGLAIVRHIVELHGGTVRADSPGSEQGATFTVKLPLLQERSPKFTFPHAVSDREIPSDSSDFSDSSNFSDSTESQSPVAAGMLTGVRVLVVEDEPDSREFLTFLLESAGAVVQATAAAPEALRAIDAFQPDVLLSDIGLPVEDGYALIRAVRAREADGARSLPAIALTAYANQEDVDRANEAGFQQHVAKPVIPDALLTTIARLTCLNACP
jgi:PAS domain S-box-containing protein